VSSGTINATNCDADGKRRSLEDSSMLRNFLWDGQNISYRTGSDDSVNRVYTYRPSMYAELSPARRPAGKSQSGESHHGVCPERSRRDRGAAPRPGLGVGACAPSPPGKGVTARAESWR